MKEEKSYLYIPMLMAKIFHSRVVDTNRVTRHVSLAEDDPARIAPTIAEVPRVINRVVQGTKIQKSICKKNRQHVKMRSQ